MNKTLTTTLTVLAALALAAVIFFAGSMYARINTFGPAMMFGWNNTSGYGPGMMNGGWHGGMTNGWGRAGGYGYAPANVTPLTIDQAKQAAENYLANLNNADLEIAEIMIFDNNGYVIVREASSGIGAFELLVDPVSQIAYSEHGPNMMWNLKYSGLNHQNMMGGRGYGMMGGMMRGYGWNNTVPAEVSAKMPVSPEQAVEYAQQYLDANFAGATTEPPMQFYGYYTLDFQKDGKIIGMLSVNGYNGQVFLHTWHGTFIEEAEYE